MPLQFQPTGGPGQYPLTFDYQSGTNTLLAALEGFNKQSAEKEKDEKKLLMQQQKSQVAQAVLEGMGGAMQEVEFSGADLHPYGQLAFMSEEDARSMGIEDPQGQVMKMLEGEHGTEKANVLMQLLGKSHKARILNKEYIGQSAAALVDAGFDPGEAGKLIEMMAGDDAFDSSEAAVDAKRRELAPLFRGADTNINIGGALPGTGEGSPINQVSNEEGSLQKTFEKVTGGLDYLSTLEAFGGKAAVHAAQSILNIEATAAPMLTETGWIPTKVIDPKGDEALVLNTLNKFWNQRGEQSAAEAQTVSRYGSGAPASTLRKATAQQLREGGSALGNAAQKALTGSESFQQAHQTSPEFESFLQRMRSKNN